MLRRRDQGAIYASPHPACAKREAQVSEPSTLPFSHSDRLATGCASVLVWPRDTAVSRRTSPGPENGSPAARRQTVAGRPMRSARIVRIPHPPHASASTTEAWSACGAWWLLHCDMLVQIFPRVPVLAVHTMRYHRPRGGFTPGKTKQAQWLFDRARARVIREPALLDPH